MSIETIIALIAALGGLAGLVSAIATVVFKIIDYRKAKKGETLEAKLQPLFDKMDKQEEELHESRLDTTRIQLIILMEHQPHNHDTIVKVAERYFCQLGGNWWTASEFASWAKREGVELPPHLWAAISKEDIK